MRFDPFVDRLSRNVRNDLSATMTRILVEKDIGPAQKVAERYLTSEMDTCYQDYIYDRLGRYQSAIEKFRSGTDDIIWQALVLWDLKLFFEVHEVLEHAWIKASGSEKKLLQALIRAAGVYIKLEYGYDEAARKMAGRAIPILREHQEFLSKYFDTELLVQALQDCNPKPPCLLS